MALHTTPDTRIPQQEETIVSGVCPHDCPDTCAWQVAVDTTSGRATRIWGHPDHPVTQGRLCGKVDRYLERTYHPQRLAEPLKRVGAKGEGRFKPISWEQAISEITERLQRTIAVYGPEAVLPYSYAGTMGILQGDGMASRFFNRLGASNLAQTICSEAGGEGIKYTNGRNTGMDTQDFAHARLILLWGTNTLTSNMHLWPFVQRARKQDARVIVIDPAHTRTAKAADEWLPIRPGSDGALALAMMHVIINEDLVDSDYVKKYTVGFPQLAGRVQQFGPDWATEITDIPTERIVQLAREYATVQPSAIRLNYGLQRHAGGGMAVRNIAALPALVGSWRQRGGGAMLSASGAFHVDKSMVKRPDLRQSLARTINMIRLGDALSLDPERLAGAHHHPRPIDPIPNPADAGPPVKALVVFNSNPAAVAPDQSAVLAGLQREDLFTVVLEHFQTDTADYADYLLPATTQLEHWDILKPYGHLYLALNQPAISPVGQSLPNSEIFRRLAEAMGYTDACFRQSDIEILQEFIAAQHHPTMDSITWERLLDEGFVRLNVPDPYMPFAVGEFPTPSGKCEFYSQRMADDGYDPLPAWTPPKISGNGYSIVDIEDTQSKKSQQYPIPGTQYPDAPRPLSLISPPAHSFLNSSFANLERFIKREKEPTAMIHPSDAGPRQIVDGDTIWLSNELGRVQLTARVTEDIIPGTVLSPGIWWSKLCHDGRNVNQLTAQDETDMGAGPLFYDVWAQIERGE